tara:strand:+ start:2677 stop:4464 length:1788 start_codon:yes stop_codon:yes gene_type:complete
MNSIIYNNSKNKISSIFIFFELWKSINKVRKKQFIFSFLLMVISGLAEVATLASIFPFLSALTNPNRIWEINYLKRISFLFGINNPFDLILPLTIIFIITSIISSLIRLLNLWYYNKVAVSTGSDFSCEVYKKVLYLPYIIHTQKNSSEYISVIVNQVSRCIEVISQFLQLFTGIILMICLLIALLITNFTLTILATIIFGSIYFLISKKTKIQLLKNSQRVSDSRRKQIKSLQEGFGAIRDVLMSGNQKTYLSLFRDTDIPMRRYEAQSSFIGMFPRFALEAFGLIFIALTSYILFIISDDFNKFIPYIATFALGAQKLLPAMQSSYNASTAIRANLISVIDVLEIIQKEFEHIEDSANFRQIIKFKKSIKISNLEFKYSSNLPLVLKNINLEIFPGQRIGIIGKSGSGKSTLLEIIMGLLEPSKGKVLIDGIDINNKDKPNLLMDWRRNISYVPQNIFLSDSSFAENIAFGLKKEEIDMIRVKDCAKRAKISDFIEGSISGYKTNVGENGIKLSSGQCQRIGIARALYKKYKILVFDEATSSLDNKTESELLESIENLSKELTVIIIAHKLSTVEVCDKVFKVEDGFLKLSKI